MNSKDTAWDLMESLLSQGSTSNSSIKNEIKYFGVNQDLLDIFRWFLILRPPKLHCKIS